MTKSESEPPVPAAPEQTSDAGEEQPAPSANDRLKDAASFIREHPGLTIAGAITAGLLAGALIPKRNRRRLIDGGARLARSAGTTGAALGRSAWEHAEQTGSEIRERGTATAELLERLAEIAVGQAEKFVGTSEKAATKASRKIARKAGELKSRMRH